MGTSVKVNSILSNTKSVKLDLDLANNFKYEQQNKTKTIIAVKNKKLSKTISNITVPHTTVVIKILFIKELKKLFPPDLVEFIVKDFMKDLTDILNDAENVIQIKESNYEIVSIFNDDTRAGNYNDHIFFKITDILKIRDKIQHQFQNEFNNKDFPILTIGVSNDPNFENKSTNNTFVSVENSTLTPTTSSALALKYARFCPIEEGPVLVFDSWFYSRLSSIVSKFLKFFITNQFNSKTISDQVKILDYVKEELPVKIINTDIINFYDKHIKQPAKETLGSAEVFEYKINIGEYGTNKYGE